MGMVPSTPGVRGPNPPVGAGAGASGASADPVVTSATARTSSLVIRPPGPVPRTCERSTPRSSAILRAMGEANWRTPTSGEPLAVGGTSTGAATVVAVARACSGPASGTDSPALPMYPMASPVGTVTPSGTTILRSEPLTGASISTTALSVSISTIASCCETVSPSRLSQATTVPFSMSYPIWGITTASAIPVRLLNQILPESADAAPARAGTARY